MIGIKAILLFSLLLGAAFLLSACGDEKYVKGTTKLRCDGVYRERNNTSSTPDYLRFFPEGSVTYCGNIVNLSPEEAYKIMLSANGDINNYGNVYRSTMFTLSNAVTVSASGGGNKVSKSPELVFELQIQGGVTT